MGIVYYGLRCPISYAPISVPLVLWINIVYYDLCIIHVSRIWFYTIVGGFMRKKLFFNLTRKFAKVLFNNMINADEFFLIIHFSNHRNWSWSWKLTETKWEVKNLQSTDELKQARGRPHVLSNLILWYDTNYTKMWFF